MDVRDVLVVTGGHRVDLDALLEMVEAVCATRGWRWAHAVQPAAQRWLHPEGRRFDAILLHDLAGLSLRRGAPPEPVGPSPEVAQALCGLLDTGQGLVVTHHALASWPGWDGWADALGGRFLYAPGRLWGRAWPSSGYRMASYRLRVEAPGHPVCAGVGDFDIDDELYLCPVDESAVLPLARAVADMDGSRFLSTYEVVVGGEESAPDCRAHPAGSDLVAWATASGRSPIVYLQPGDSALTFGLAGYRRLVANALQWVASDEAHEWAAARTGRAA